MRDLPKNEAIEVVARQLSMASEHHRITLKPDLPRDKQREVQNRRDGIILSARILISVLATPPGAKFSVDAAQPAAKELRLIVEGQVSSLEEDVLKHAFDMSLV